MIIIRPCYWLVAVTHRGARTVRIPEANASSIAGRTLALARSMAGKLIGEYETAYRQYAKQVARA